MNTFLKWPGGKKWLVKNHAHIFPNNYNRYIEPFLGGGSVFFHLTPEESILSDINLELINVYSVMRDHDEELVNLLIQHQQRHSHEYYYQIRSQNFDNDLERAARFIYLNRTCFNGMYRVNRAGGFNVPIGTRQNFLFDIAVFHQYSVALQNADLRNSDFSDTIREAEAGDLIFADPPYTIAHNQNCFISYNEHLFTWNDQERLLADLIFARNNNAIIFATNANYPLLRNMYLENGFFVNTIERYSSIAGIADRRGKQEEILISSIQI